MLPDGANGAIIVWEDPSGTPSASTSDRDLFGERLDNAGTKLWAPASTIGKSLIAVTGIQQTPQIAADGAGGFVAVWADQRTGTNGGGDIYAQRFNNTGTKLWPADVQIVSAAGFQSNPSVVKSSNKFVFAWSDPRAATSDRNIYVQQTDMDGVLQWTPTGGAALDGIPVVTSTGQQPASSTFSGFVLVSDSTGGAFVVWDDARSPGSTSSPHMYAQKISNTGAILWAENGTVVSNATNGQKTPVAIQNGGGGIIVAWTDSRNGNVYNELYASQVYGGGALPVEFITIGAAQTMNAIQVSWEASCDNATSHFIIEKSADGLSFTNIGVVKAAIVAARCVTNYSFTDNRPSGGINYYRIKGFNKDGNFRLSGLARVNANANGQLVQLYPNPVHNVLTLQLTNLEKGAYTIRVNDMSGKLLQVSRFNVALTFQTSTVNVAPLAPGKYMVSLVNEKGVVIKTNSIIKQ